MNWKTSLDKWLTTDPNEGYYSYIENVVEHLTNDFYTANEDWIMKGDTLFDTWVDKLYHKDLYHPKRSAEIIERAHKFYKCHEN